MKRFLLFLGDIAILYVSLFLTLFIRYGQDFEVEALIDFIGEQEGASITIEESGLEKRPGATAEDIREIFNYSDWRYEVIHIQNLPLPMIGRPDYLRKTATGLRFSPVTESLLDGQVS